jgi:hypothetical protein
MRRYRDKSSVFDVLPILLLLGLGVFVLLLLLFSPQILEYAKRLELPSIGEIPQIAEMPEAPPQNQTHEPALSPDAQFYFSLKNKSCQTLSGNFLIATTDVSKGSVQGLSGLEASAAGMMIAGFESNQTTKTYVRNDSMKKVIISGSLEHTTIWKEGRIYQCNPNCTMRLLGDAGWQA